MLGLESSLRPRRPTKATEKVKGEKPLQHWRTQRAHLLKCHAAKQLWIQIIPHLGASVMMSKGCLGCGLFLAMIIGDEGICYQEELRSAPYLEFGRIRYWSHSRELAFIRCESPEFGHEPTVSEAEADWIVALPDVESVMISTCPIERRELTRIVQKHDPKYISLSFARDETCKLLLECKRLESLDVWDGDVTVTGLIFLRRLKSLRKLSVATREHSLVSRNEAENAFLRLGVEFELKFLETAVRQSD